jgi:hypothetical protein
MLTLSRAAVIALATFWWLGSLGSALAAEANLKENLADHSSLASVQGFARQWPEMLASVGVPT